MYDYPGNIKSFKTLFDFVYNRHMRKKITKDNYQYMRKKGQQNLRVTLVLFTMFLLCYAVLGYVIVDMLFSESELQALLQYLMKVGGMLIVWLFLVRLLWRFRKIGRSLFTLAALLSLFSLNDMKAIIDVTIDDQTDSLLRYLFAALMISKIVLIFACMLKMRTDPLQRCIWSAYIVYEDSLDDELEEIEEEEASLQEIPFQQNSQAPLILRLPQSSPIVQKAKKHIRINAFLLTGACFGGFLFFYFFLMLMQLNYRDDIGIPYVQRQIMLSTLFSILIWMFPIVAMFFYHRFTRVLFFIAWLCELIRQVSMISDIVQVFTSQHYSILSAFLLVLVEAVRYVCFYQLTMRVLRDPFIHTYWSKTFRTKEPYE